MRLFVIALLILAGCAPVDEPQESLIDRLANEQINYTTYSENGLSVQYPDWPDVEPSEVEVAVSKGYCSVAINTEKLPAKQWYDMFLESIEKQEGKILFSHELHLKYSVVFQNHSMISDNSIYECNDKSTVVTVTCIEETREIMEKISDYMFSSVKCEEKPVQYLEFSDDDFSVKHPDWDEMDQGHLLERTRGVCSVIVDKHNALPEDILDWLKTSIKNKEDHTLIAASDNQLSFRLMHNEKTITATTRILYCNYLSYITQVLCMDEFASEADDEARDIILESVKCARVYEVPTAQKIEEKQKEIMEDEPEVIEEIEEKIVRTDAGAEFGINAEMVVYFINSNSFFTRIMSDFSRANLVIEDTDRELRLRVELSDGKITLLEDGEFSNPDVTLIVPLQDALNVLNNAQNINPLNLLAFAVNVRTEPAHVKNEVIQKVLRGEYN